MFFFSTAVAMFENQNVKPPLVRFANFLELVLD
jgi:hypothetical protein